MSDKIDTWRPHLPEGDNAPIYKGIADAIAADIDAGRLRSGQRLPTHRRLASLLGVNLTTITRAYNEAHRRGLIEAGVGRGTFVRRRPPGVSAAPAGDGAEIGAAGAAVAVDMTMNVPPQPAHAELREQVAHGLTTVLARRDFPALLSYVESAGSERDRAAGARLLRRRLGEVPTDRILVCAGAQSALLVLATTLLQRGDRVLAESLTYPGFRKLAAHLGLRLEGVAIDDQGLVPEALAEACARAAPRALFCVPTLHNPTTATMPLQRRQAIAAVLRRYGVRVFEDDAYGLLPRQAPPPLATLVPELAFYVASLAKCIAPGLRIAYLVAPDAAMATRLAAGLRAATQMTPPLMVALATQWVADGTAERLIDAVREEGAARQLVAAQILPAELVKAHPDGHHLWLTLPATLSRVELDAHLRQLGLAVVPSDAFVVDGPPPSAIRISLGAARDRNELRRALRFVADAITRMPGYSSMVI